MDFENIKLIDIEFHKSDIQRTWAQGRIMVDLFSSRYEDE